MIFHFRQQMACTICLPPYQICKMTVANVFVLCSQNTGYEYSVQTETFHTKVCCLYNATFVWWKFSKGTFVQQDSLTWNRQNIVSMKCHKDVFLIWRFTKKILHTGTVTEMSSYSWHRWKNKNWIHWKNMQQSCSKHKSYGRQ